MFRSNPKTLLGFNQQKKVFEFNQELCEAYIQSCLQQDCRWNETQLNLIIETIVNAMDSIFEIYQNYPGDTVRLLEDLQAANKLGKKDPKQRFWDEIVKQADLPYPKPLRELFDFVAKPYQICIGRLYDLKLDRGLQERFTISEHQIKFLHQIMANFLNEAIKTIKASEVYKEAQCNNSLHFTEEDVEVLKSLGRRVPEFEANTLPSQERMEQLKKEFAVTQTPRP